ncbi:hypothetical protein [uncultured Fibrella sp.]|uniref:hypothetical protein n=1 Tax=uncultured Fibrella sp. TaxID=1284596 RepID=UPI0035CBA558
MLVPLLGIGTFLVLFLLATYLYPGGSQADKQAVGFSWLHNYWCNLLNVYAMNGQPNLARPVALAAMSVLCISLSIFWYFLPLLFTFSQRGSLLIRSTGIGSMLSALFIFTNFHDLVINIAGFLGLITLTGTFIGLYKCRLIKLLWLGIGCLLLMVVNNYIYYTSDSLYYLPLVQKVTFAFVLLWISLLTIQMVAQRKVAITD